jgi:hypothetical protein
MVERIVEMKYDFSGSDIEHLMNLNYICTISKFPEDKEMKKEVINELNKRLKKNPNYVIDFSRLVFSVGENQ